VEEQVQHLVEAGLVGVMAHPEGITLAKPPELISIVDVLNAVHHGRGNEDAAYDDTDKEVLALLQRRDQAVASARAGYTLRSLVDGPKFEPSIQRVSGETSPVNLK
ncbi:MAG TPA: hypothetical protein VM842_00875, partial [Nitrospira sp.]|nr:hypothetical protein [Nitrospira sp.]